MELSPLKLRYWLLPVVKMQFVAIEKLLFGPGVSQTLSPAFSRQCQLKYFPAAQFIHWQVSTSRFIALKMLSPIEIKPVQNFTWHVAQCPSWLSKYGSWDSNHRPADSNQVSMALGYWNNSLGAGPKKPNARCLRGVLLFSLCWIVSLDLGELSARTSYLGCDIIFWSLLCIALLIITSPTWPSITDCSSIPNL